MSNSGKNSTEKLLQEMIASVNTLKNDVNDLKAKDGGRTYPQKLFRDGGGEVDGDASHDGDNAGS